MERDREMEKDKPPKVKYRTKEKTSNRGERGPGQRDRLEKGMG